MKLTNPKNGEQFASVYKTHLAAHAALLGHIAAGEFGDRTKFPQDIYDATGMKTVNKVQVQQGSASQLFWLHKLATDGGKRQPVKSSIKADLAPVKGMLVAAKGNGLKYPKITLTTSAGLEVKVSLAGDESRNPGCVYIASGGRGGAYYGKVNPAGEFFPGRNYVPEIGVLLSDMARSPKAAAAAQGALTGRCCFCNKALDESKSVALGYGPVCAKKYGLTHTKKDADRKAFHSGLRGPQRDLLGEEIKPKARVIRRISRKIENALTPTNRTMSKKYNVYSETDMEAVKSALTNLGLDPNETGRWRITEACDLVRWGMESLCDGVGEDEAERCLAEEVLAAKVRLAEA